MQHWSLQLGARCRHNAPTHTKERCARPQHNTTQHHTPTHQGALCTPTTQYNTTHYNTTQHGTHTNTPRSACPDNTTPTPTHQKVLYLHTPHTTPHTKELYTRTPHHTPHLHQLQVCQQGRVCEGSHEHIHHASSMQHITVHCSGRHKQRQRQQAASSGKQRHTQIRSCRRLSGQRANPSCTLDLLQAYLGLLC